MRELNCQNTIILVTYSSWTPTLSLVVGILEAFAQKYNIKIRTKDSGKVTKTDILMSDTILLVRPYDVSCSDIVAAAKKCGKFLIVYLDDDLLNIPDLYSSPLRTWISRILKSKNQRALRRCLEGCDILWGSNPFLLRKYEKYVHSGKCVKTDVVADISNMQPVNRREDDAVRILFAGAPDHADLLNKYIIPALNNLAIQFPKMQMTCAGIDEGRLRPCRLPVKCIRWKDSIEEYRAAIAGGKYHIGIAVVEESDFYRCKYFNKFIEYSVLGAAGLYTDSEPYRYVVRNGENGYLVKSTPEDWTEAIAYAVKNPKLTEKCAESAQTDVRERFQLEKILEQLNSEIPELQEKRRATTKTLFYRRRFFWYAIRKIGMYAVNSFEALMGKIREKQ